MKIAVIALGKIGLPLAVQFASKGHDVVGVDINTSIVELVNKGSVPFPGEADLDRLLAEVVAQGKLVATTSYEEAVPNADAVVIVVPLIVDAEARPDFGPLDSATNSLASTITPGTVVAYEVTLPVGTTRNRWKPLLEKESGLVEGEDFHLVFSPERVFSGRIFADLRNYPKLLGGFSPAGVLAATDFYNAVLDFDERPDLSKPNGVWNLDSVEAAEFAKLAETTYRDVNIGLANQFARFADRNGIDVSKVIEATNSQPFSDIHRPGISVGGHCIPVYPRLYLWNDPDATIVRAAREANSEMPEYAVGVLERAFGSLSGLKVVVFGAAYRGGVKETAFSGVFPTVAALKARGATAVVHDPLFTDAELNSFGFEAHSMGDPADAAIIQTDHREYRGLVPADVPGIRALVDGRRVTSPEAWRSVSYQVIGGGMAVQPVR
ncbi:nucleotide sugar dehydrogenase [Salinibacterium sp. PAMC 21357]|uniref:nucleotide sugar dehydrogenase n=1 Tax=Salinibacterium sp. PAMC 21357 TaxID=1112215 RepID=UPI000288CFE0|nr:nucleotide sugar dehydrogenase [Salinibacterium sp. PAMC 21357]